MMGYKNINERATKLSSIAKVEDVSLRRVYLDNFRWEHDDGRHLDASVEEKILGYQVVR